MLRILRSSMLERERADRCHEPMRLLPDVAAFGFGVGGLVLGVGKYRYSTKSAASRGKLGTASQNMAAWHDVVDGKT